MRDPNKHAPPEAPDYGCKKREVSRLLRRRFGRGWGFGQLDFGCVLGGWVGLVDVGEHVGLLRDCVASCMDVVGVAMGLWGLFAVGPRAGFVDEDRVGRAAVATGVQEGSRRAGAVAGRDARWRQAAGQGLGYFSLFLRRSGCRQPGDCEESKKKIVVPPSKRNER